MRASRAAFSRRRADEALIPTRRRLHFIALDAEGAVISLATLDMTFHFMLTLQHMTCSRYIHMTPGMRTPHGVADMHYKNYYTLASYRAHQYSGVKMATKKLLD